tara:strand:- start:375 stop:734 length:360 start_codon:yes stop_codon:yes gene_type:complete
MDTILIEGLSIFCIVGMFPHEREHPQMLRVDLKMFIPQVLHNDELKYSVDYSAVCRWLEHYVQEQKFQTLERAAQSIIFEMFALWERIEEIELTLRKPAAVPKANAVGFVMRRTRSSLK